jgi:hypothetical protein
LRFSDRINASDAPTNGEITTRDNAMMRMALGADFAGDMLWKE